MDDAERERIARYRRLDDAFRRGDMPALEAELGAQEGFPNVVADPAMGACLTFAIYHSPVSLVRALLDAGADPNWPDADGFPPLIAALSCSQPAPGAVVRLDVHELVALLLEAGARSTNATSTTTRPCTSPPRTAISSPSISCSPPGGSGRDHADRRLRNRPRGRHGRRASGRSSNDCGR